MASEAPPLSMTTETAPLHKENRLELSRPEFPLRREMRRLCGVD